MASNFSANQFNHEYKSTRLCNWEVPKWHRERPIHPKSTTKIISNNRGHLLPGVARPKSSPWGNFKSTWQLPDKITKEQAIQLHSPIVGHTRWNKPREKSMKLKPEDIKNFCYIPGDLTEETQVHHTRNSLVNEPTSASASKHQHLPPLNSLYVEQHKCTDEGELLNKTEKTARDKSNGGTDEHILSHIEQLPDCPDATDEKMRSEVTEKPGENNTIPLIPAVYNFQSARKMAQENLEHQPLPDSIMDRAYRKMQAQGAAYPELALDVYPVATGVGVKTYNAGPTHCTKLKVYRPKTCGIVPKPLHKSMGDLRPQTAINEKEKTAPMDLAICWDYRPLDPRDEPKPPTHIDGSNGSVAPAVFTVVKTPRTANDEVAPTGRSGGVFSNTIGEEGFFDKDIMLRTKNYFSTRLEKNTDRTCRCDARVVRDARDSQEARDAHDARDSATQRNTQSNARSKSSPNLSVLAQASDAAPPNESIVICNYNREHYHYRPESQRHHHHHHHHQQHQEKTKQKMPKQKCEKHKSTNRLCEQNIIAMNQSNHPKPEYKSAFKAGIPKSNSSGICSSFDSCASSNATASDITVKTIKIPKPRNPYQKKNYVIDTLAPPFSCWKGGAGQGGYPEHWRLASVYQHAYKPVEQRKRPLLATVYQ